MKDYPAAFPKYIIDLKQMYDELNRPDLRTYPNYPKQENEHNALDDAIWNKKLHNFLKKL